MLFPLLLALAALGLQRGEESREPIPGIPEIELRALPPLDLLQADGPPPEIRDVRDFCVLGSERLAILRADQTLLVTDEYGTIQRTLRFTPFRIPLGPLLVRLDGFEHVEWTGESQVLLAPRYPRNHGRQRDGLLRVDLAADRLEIAALLPDSTYPVELASSPDGELAFLAHPDSSCTSVYVLDERGELVWSRSRGVCAASSIVFDDAGRVQLLDRGACALQSFRWHGWWSSYTRFRLGLDETIGRLELVAAGARGLALAHETREASELLRTDEDLRRPRRVTLAHADGTPLDRRVRLDSAGRIWASDGWSISLCGEDGSAWRTLGDAPKLRKLGREPRVGIRRDDTLYAITMRDGTLHEFDALGVQRKLVPLERKRRVYGRDLPPEFESRLGASAFEEEPASDGRRARAVRDWEAERCTIVIDAASGGELARWDLPAELTHALRSLDLEGDVLALATPFRLVVYRADGRPRLQMPIPAFDQTSARIKIDFSISITSPAAAGLASVTAAPLVAIKPDPAIRRRPLR